MDIHLHGHEMRVWLETMAGFAALAMSRAVNNKAEGDVPPEIENGRRAVDGDLRKQGWAFLGAVAALIFAAGAGIASAAKDNANLESSMAKQIEVVMIKLEAKIDAASAAQTTRLSFLEQQVASLIADQHKGGRFTSGDGDRLRNRLDMLEQRVDSNSQHVKVTEERDRTMATRLDALEGRCERIMERASGGK